MSLAQLTADLCLEATKYPPGITWAYKHSEVRVRDVDQTQS